MSHWRVLIPMIVSCGAMLAGFASIIMGAEKTEASFLIAAQLIMLSMILDGFDGNIARLIKGTSKFGGEFDTYVDIMSFGVAPALLSYWTVMHNFGTLGLLFSASILLSGMMRLSRFRVMDDDRGMRGYTGLPITVNAAWVALILYIVLSGHVGLGIEDLRSGIFSVVVWSISAALVILQVSNVQYSKPTKHWIFIIPSAILILGLFLDLHVGAICAIGMCAYGLFYAFVSPLLPRKQVIIDLDEEFNEDPA